jgi:hypothetical protein
LGAPENKFLKKRVWAIAQNYLHGVIFKQLVRYFLTVAPTQRHPHWLPQSAVPVESNPYQPGANMSTKAKRELAETLSKTLVQSIKKNSIVADDMDKCNAYTVGYLESFLASLMAENPKVMATVAYRIQAIHLVG